MGIVILRTAAVFACAALIPVAQAASPQNQPLTLTLPPNLSTVLRHR